MKNKDKIKVLIVNDRYLPDTSGTSIRPSRLIEPLVVSGVCDFHVVTYMETLNERGGEPLKKRESISGVDVHRFSNDFELFQGIYNLHKIIRFDIIHTRGIKYFLFSKLISIINPCKVIFELNTLPVGGILREMLLHFALYNSDRLILLSKHAKKWANGVKGVNEKKIDIVLNGINIARYQSDSVDEQLKRRLGLEQKIVIGYCGSFFQWQGVFRIIEVAKRIKEKYSNVRFILVGTGPDHKKTKEMAENLGVEKDIVFTGSVSPSEIPRFLSIIDIYLLLRPTSYLKSDLAVPLKLFEAMAMECAVVVTPVKGLTEVLEDHKTGLIANDSIDSIISVLDDLIMDQELRKALGRNAREVVNRDFTWEDMALKLYQSYLGTLDS